jgi:ribose transport system ATP-binding protein
VALRVKNLTLDHRLADVSFDLHQGEVLGVAGLDGHGQRELFYVLFGINRAKKGIELWGQPVSLRSPRNALTIRGGIALVSDDRENEGLLPSKSVRENLTLSCISRFTRFCITDATREAELVGGISASLKITASPEQPAGTLSGGNQQKLIFGKMLLTEARVLLLYDPTRGIDVGAKEEIFRLIRDLCQEGYAILFYSSDLPELSHIADRVAVFRSGRVVTILDGETIAESDILRAMIGKEAV